MVFPKIGTQHLDYKYPYEWSGKAHLLRTPVFARMSHDGGAAPRPKRPHPCLTVTLPADALRKCMRCLSAPELARVEMCCPRLRTAVEHAMREVAAGERRLGRLGFLDDDGVGDVSVPAGACWSAVARYLAQLDEVPICGGKVAGERTAEEMRWIPAPSNCTIPRADCPGQNMCCVACTAA